MLSQEIALTHPKGLISIILANGLADSAQFVKGCNEWRQLLPDDVQATLLKYERAEDYDAPEYKAAAKV